MGDFTQYRFEIRTHDYDNSIVMVVIKNQKKNNNYIHVFFFIYGSRNMSELFQVATEHSVLSVFIKRINKIK